MSEIKELHTKIRDLKKKHAKLRIDKALGQLSDTSQLRKVRKEIARECTELSKKEREVPVIEKKDASTEEKPEASA